LPASTRTLGLWSRRTPRTPLPRRKLIQLRSWRDDLRYKPLSPLSKRAMKDRTPAADVGGARPGAHQSGRHLPPKKPALGHFEPLWDGSFRCAPFQSDHFPAVARPPYGGRHSFSSPREGGLLPLPASPSSVIAKPLWGTIQAASIRPQAPLRAWRQRHGYGPDADRTDRSNADRELRRPSSGGSPTSTSSKGRGRFGLARRRSSKATARCKGSPTDIRHFSYLPGQQARRGPRPVTFDPRRSQATR